MIRSFFSVITLLMLMVFQAHAQTIIAQNISQREGLPEAETHFLFKDSRGFLWVGTANGLFRYDGYNFKSYKNIPGQANCLVNNWISAVDEDEKGNIWIGTSNGLSILDPSREKFTNYPSLSSDSISGSSSNITSIFKDRSKRIWICTYAGLFLYEKPENGFREFHFHDQIRMGRSDITGRIEEDSSGFFWITSGEGLYRFNLENATYETFYFKPDDKKNFKFNNQFMTLQINPFRQDELWIGSWGAGLLCFNIRSKAWKQFLFDSANKAPPNISNIVFRVLFTDSTHLFITSSRGFGEFDIPARRFIFFPHEKDRPYSLPDGGEYFMRDDQDIFWVCAASGFSKAEINRSILFINHIQGAPFAFYKPLNSDSIFFLTVYNRRSFGVLDKETGTAHTIPLPQLDKNFAEASDLIRDRKGLFWLTTTKGLYTYDEKRNTLKQVPLTVINAPNANTISLSDIEEDNDGNLYFASESHPVIRKNIDEEGFSSSLRDSLGEKGGGYAFALCRDSAGNIWMASRTHVAEFNPSTQVTTYFPDGRFHFFISKGSYFTGITLDRNGNPWLASTEGVIRFRVHSEKTDSAVSHFFKGEYISNVATGADGFVWAQLFSGYVRVHPEKNYSIDMGAEYGLGNPANEGGMMPLSNGQLILKTAYGNVVLDPAELHEQQRDVKLLLHHFKVFNTDFPLKSDVDDLNEIKLNHDQNSFSIEFNALELYSPSTLQYLYRLSGIDKDWVTGDKRFASYSQLAPGTYLFEVRAFSPDGNITSATKKLSIVIVPAFYQTWWFKSLAVIAIVLLLVWFVSFISTQRLKRKLIEAEKQKEIDAVRNRISRDMHDEIGAMLTRISVMSDTTLLEDDATAKANMGKVRNLAHQSAKGLSEIIWSVNPRHDHLENMLAYFRQYIQDFLDDTQFAYKINFPKKPSAMNVNPELRRNLFLVLKESLNNAVKYSKAKLISVEFVLEGNNFSMKISDDGIGFDAGSVKTGNGLHNIKARMEAVNCSCKIISAVGQGANVEIQGSLF